MLMNESKNVQRSYNIQYTIFGIMYIFLGLLQLEGTMGRCCYIGECSTVHVYRALANDVVRDDE